MSTVVQLAPYRARRVAAGELQEPWLSKKSIARHFDVTTSTIDRWCVAGMPFMQPPRGHRRFQVSACEAWHGDRA